jgi:hypothetical protein
MCPFCLATMGIFLAGAVSTGGLGALAAKVSLKNNEVQTGMNLSQRSNHHGNEEYDRQSQSSVARRMA